MKEISKEQAIVIHMLIGTLLSYVRPEETTKKIDKLRKLARKNLNKIHNQNKEYYFECAKKADSVWLETKKIINDEHFEIFISAAMMSLYKFVDGTKYQTMWFGKSAWEQGIQSMLQAEMDHTKDVDFGVVESNSYNLMDMFGKELGIASESKLTRLKKKLYNNLVLEGKIK